MTAINKTRFIASLLVFVLVLCFGLVKSSPAQAASARDWNAGRIIDNVKFFNSNTMTVSQIQSFLVSKVPDCDTWGEEASGHVGYATRADWGRAHSAPPPYTCLKNYKKDTPARSASSQLCDSMPARSNRTAAQIINDVANACGVSEKVMLVLLQKEQGLVTDDWPWPVQYRSATGYGCPDTAPCDSQYYGFFNQVYNAAKQFKRYARDPENYNFNAGHQNYIRYNPRSSCGGASVAIINQATAGLYNYTPYQPNRAALNNLYGTGDSCSAYGNRNFWRMYTDWFGPTLSGTTLVQEEGDASVYLVSNGSKIPIPSMTIFNAWGFGGLHIYNLTPETMDMYPTSAHNLSWLAVSSTSGRTYFIDRGRNYYVNRAAARTAWGLDDDFALTVSGAVISSLDEYKSLPVLTKQVGQTPYYLVNGGQRFQLTSASTLSLMQGQDKTPKVQAFSSDAMSLLSNGAGTINYSFKVGEQWYIFDYGVIRPVNSAYITNWKVSGPTLSSDVLSFFRTAKELKQGFRYSGRYYKVTNDGHLRSTSNKSTATRWGVATAPYISKQLVGKIW